MNRQRWIVAVALGLVELGEVVQVPAFVRAGLALRELIEYVEFWIEVVRPR